MYVQIDQFAIDKMSATIIEESGISAAFIREYWRRRGKKVNRIEKNLGDYHQQSLYDLADIFAKWEVKNDRLFHVTGNLFIELNTLEKTQADKYLIFAGPAYVVPVNVLREAIKGRPTTVGGDMGRSTGVLLRVEELEEISEEVIVL